MLIDTTIFKGSIQLIVTDVNVAPAVTQAIAEYQPQYLAKAFGADFATLFTTGLVEPVGGGFSNGFSNGFQIGGIDPRWTRLAADERLKRALACYVYYMYREQTITYVTSTGNERKSNSENSNQANPAEKMIRAWNQMVELNRELWRYIPNVTDTSGAYLYPEFAPYRLCRSLYTKQPLFAGL